MSKFFRTLAQKQFIAGLLIFFAIEAIVIYFVYLLGPLEYTLYMPENIDQSTLAFTKLLTFIGSWFTLTFVLASIFVYDYRRNCKTKKAENNGGIATILRKNKVSLIFIGVHIFFGLPWIFAFHGIFVDDIPLLNMIFIARVKYEGYPAVHLGSHHGYSGLLIIIIAIISYHLSKTLCSNKLQKFLRFCSIYGLLFGLNWYWEDFTNEQLFKRGIISFKIPLVSLSKPLWLNLCLLLSYLVLTVSFLIGVRKLSRVS